MHNLLRDPVIRVDFDIGGGVKAVSLPEAYTLLMQDRVNSFPALRPHQRSAWHMFLVQAGVMALHNSGIKAPFKHGIGRDHWEGALRSLTHIPGISPNFTYLHDEPWRLVVDDIRMPAFMQPPASSWDMEKDYKNESSTPDALDILVTSKNFEVKLAQAQFAQPDDWLFALITLQTMGGFGGSGNYGVARMNGGLSNRPQFGLAPSPRIGACVRRDIEALLSRDFIGNMWMGREGQGYPGEDGPPMSGARALVWLRDWDGRKDEAIPWQKLNPLFIEICRRVRLRVSDAEGGLPGESLLARKAVSRGPRIDPGDSKGAIGDPWAPVSVSDKERKALTVSAGGFTHRRMAQWLSGGEWRLPELCRASEDEIGRGGMTLTARALVRGQGKTEGYYEYHEPVGKRMTLALTRRQSEEARDLAHIAKGRVEQITAVNRILSHAIQIFVAGGNVEGLSPERRKLARPYLNDMDKRVDAGFMADLQRELDADGEDERRAIRADWLMNDRYEGIVNLARAQLRAAQASLPCPSIHKHKAEAKSTGMFEGRLRGESGLPFLFGGGGGAGGGDNESEKAESDREQGRLIA